ncbi:hypothetical protein [Arthrobacter sp. Ld5]|uniref:hypothetical protein n=1 Tax=Arthrobacter sp. Ld5 TaxID=649152 RepID=UPI003EBA4A98
MQHGTRSLLIAFTSAAALVAAPVVMEVQGRTDEAVAVPAPTAAAPSAVPSSVPAVAPPSSSAPAVPVPAGGSPAVSGAVDAPAAPGPTPPAPLPADPARGGDLPPESLPTPPYPQCPITEEGAWWSDPGDPYTCLPPGSMMFHEPTPPGIPPELLEPIFEDPATAPAPEDDCRVTGAMQCVVVIMGQEYTVTFADGRPVGVVEAQG